MSEAKEEGVVVIVDDEEMVLTSIASFLNLETAYEVATFTRAADALQYIVDHDVDLVISDFLMPEMDGLLFLAKVREVKPLIPRIILTGYADKENAVKAINEVGLYQYLEKPWDNDDLRIIIRNGVEKKRLLERLHRKIDEIDSAYADLEGIQKDILKAFV